MNIPFNVKINTPCTENYDTFSTTEQGGFCGSCKKEVIDFTKMNAQEIADYFQKNSTQNTCGKFKSQQLATDYHPIPRRSKLGFISGLGLTILALFSFGKAKAQDINKNTKGLDQHTTKLQDTTSQKKITVKGIVTDAGEPLPGVNIILEGTTIGTQANFDGEFEFPEKLNKGDVLIVSYIGYDSKKIEIQNENSAQDISLKVNLETYGCTLMGDIAVQKVYQSKKE